MKTHEDERSRQEPPPVTAESIARAKQHVADERQRVFEVTGVRITDDGFTVKAPWLIHCPRPGCRFVGSARTDGWAVRSLSCHLVGAHMKEQR